jgi:TolA-binding protein
MEAVLFYRAESFFARHLYDQALKDYEKIVTEFPDSNYLGDSLFRIMLIHEKFGTYEQIYKYFEHLKSLAQSVDRNCYDKCTYMAGYVYFKNSELTKAKEALSNVSKDSKYYMVARYLLGLVFVNQGNYTYAPEIFEDLANKENYPWTDSKTAFIRNSALLKLGFLNYEQGEYQQASKYFERVSPGFESYDKALLGNAWTNLKLGNHEKSIENVNRLFQDYLASNYTYEALVLSAYSKKQVQKQESALQDLRYVANARTALELSDKYNSERRKILEQLTVLDQLEQAILERRDRHLYSITSQIRDHLQTMLLQFKNRGSSGNRVLQRYEDERKSIMAQVDELDHIILQALASGDNAVADKAHSQRQRLLRVLEVYQADKDLRDVNFFIDYPLATKEGSFKYRKGILSDVAQGLEAERMSIQKSLREIQALRVKARNHAPGLNTKLDLEILENELQSLSHESMRFRSWLADNQVEVPKTDFNQWADFSGFGMSDITFSGIREKEETVLTMAENKEVISRFLGERKKELEKRLHEFEKQAQKIEEELQQEQIKL